MNKPKMEKSLTNVNEGSQQSQEGTSFRCTILKFEKDANFSYACMPFTKPMFNEDVGKVEEVLALKQSIWKLVNVRLKQLEKKKKCLQDHLIGLKFSMEDRKLACQIAEAKILTMEAKL
jgi:hypothetical protein